MACYNRRFAKNPAMLKLRSLFLVLLCFPVLVIAQQLPTPPALAAKSWLLVEMASGQQLAAQAPDQRLEPASLTKLMTAYLSFAAIKQGTIKLDQAVPVSQKAWKTGGSRMFIQIGTQVKVEDLLKGMIVQSGNDACVALAEAIAGDEENFAQMMNREAQRLGMKGSSFRNSSGLPDPQHYTTARDLAILAGALIRDFPEEYAKYYSMKEFRYNNITQPNRNRLLYIDPTVDGLKTGSYRGGRLLSGLVGEARVAPPAVGGPRARHRTARARRNRSSCSTTASSSTTPCSCTRRTRRSPA
jgi:D-alanyl-D-alanine carboxypeptidase (penicillin-binding protein 5/6)